MLKDIIDTVGYNRMLEEIELNTQLGEGLYIKIDLDKEIKDQEYLIITNKKNEEIENMELYNWFKERLPYCEQFESNKSILTSQNCFQKKLKSTNYLCYSANIKTIREGYKNSKLNSMEDYLKNLINEYTDILINTIYTELEKSYKKVKNSIDNKNNLFFKYMKYVKSEERLLKVNKTKEYLFKNIKELVELVKNNIDIAYKKSSIYILINIDRKTYKKEYELYSVWKVFSEIKNIYVKDNIIFGMQSYNFTLNKNKKPFLSNRSKVEEIPCYVPLEEAIKYRFLDKWIQSTNKVKVDNLRFKWILKNAVSEVINFDNIPFENSKIKINCKISNYLNNQYFKEYIITEKFALKNDMDKSLFNNNLNKDLKSNIEDGIFTIQMKNILNTYKSTLDSYFNYNNDIRLKKIIKIMVTKLLKSQFDLKDIKTEKNEIIQREYLIKNSVNFGLSLIDYFNKEGESMKEKIENIYNKLNEKINSKENVYIDSDDEFYFLAGQLAYYLVSLSREENKTYTLLKPFMNCKSSKMLMNKIKMKLDRYGYDISLNSIRIRKTLSMLSTYSPIGQKINHDNNLMIIAGSQMENLIYIKKENTIEKKGEN